MDNHCVNTQVILKEKRAQIYKEIHIATKLQSDAAYMHHNATIYASVKRHGQVVVNADVLHDFQHGEDDDFYDSITTTINAAPEGVLLHNGKIRARAGTLIVKYESCG